MLKQLTIQNIAIIERLALEFHPGLTVITGESGSGKSILLDAVSLAFGAKVSPREILRSGCERGQVELLFDAGGMPDQPAFRAFLAEQGVELTPDETEILLTRELTSGGSRSRINGTPVTREVLARLRPWVMDLHGQHELTSLFQSERQRAYLDAFGGSPLSGLKREVATVYDAWQGANQKLETLRQDRETAIRQQDFLRFQLNELDEAQVSDADEDAQARRELDVLRHAETLLKISAQGAALLSEGDGQTPAVTDQIALLEKKLSEGAAHDPALEAILSRVQGLRAEMKDVAAELSRYRETVEVNPERVSQLTDRLDQLEKLKRKYGPTLREVIATHEKLARELARLEVGEQNLAALEADLIAKEQVLSAVSGQLSEARRRLAEELKTHLTNQLQALAMPGVSFDIVLSPTGFSREGMEAVEFQFSANPGEALKPLAKVASGGELSRFLLAMKVLTAQSDGLATLVFDEIDTGISGPTAKTVAEKLGSLSRRLQVLAITHQPMVAAMGHQHLHVEKRVHRLPSGEETVTVGVERLDLDEKRRVRVLGRLIGGAETSDEAAEKFIRRLQADARAFYRAVEDAQLSTAE